MVYRGRSRRRDRGHARQTDCLIPPSRSDALAIRAETHAVDRTRMSLDRVEFLARRRVPQTDCFVLTSRGDASAIGADTQAEDSTRISLERGSLHCRYRLIFFRRRYRLIFLFRIRPITRDGNERHSKQ